MNFFAEDREATGAVSFTDDTSLPYGKPKVSIHAQVLRDSELDWFYTIRGLFPVGQGQELKSANIPTKLFTLAANEQERIFHTLKRVRIHVTDPRLPSHDVAIAIRGTVKGGDAKDFLPRLERAQQQVVSREIVRRMLSDSPAERLKNAYKFREYTNGLRLLDGHVWIDPPSLEADLDRFTRTNKNMVNIASEFIAKSGSVFFDALEQLDELASFDPMLASGQISRELRHSHAFDEGNAPAVEWLRDKRRSVLSLTDRLGVLSDTLPGPLVEVSSGSSPLTQAADVAAGVARELWAKHGLVRVITSFDYVADNGKRVSETEAANIQRSLSSSAN